jgi:hypothetical protein
MTDRQFLRLSEKWALAFDSHQWIIQRRRGKKWDSIAFVGSEKRVLQRALAEKGAEISPEALAALARLPDRFLEWLEKQRRAEPEDKPARRAAE